MVRDFSDVFPEELPGFPLEHEIEFAIKVQSGTNSILIPPYRMALTEQKKLETQLSKLLNKGYVRMSISPWGALVIFVKKKMKAFVCILITDS